MKTVCKNTRLESTSKESTYAVHSDDSLCGLPIPDTALVRLAVGLDDAERVGHGVGEDGRAEADEGLTEKLLDERVRARQVLVEEIVRPKPLETLSVEPRRESYETYRIMSDESGSSRRKRAVPQCTDTVLLNLCHRNAY